MKKKIITYTITLLLAAMIGFSALITASPVLAMKYASQLPIVKELVKLNEENADLKNKLQVNDKAIEEYKDTMSEEDRNEVANVVLEFVRAQYSGNKGKMYSLCSDLFAGQLKNDPYLAVSYGKDVELKFVIISNIVKHEGKYLAFIRIEDNRMDSQYQENFYLDKKDGRFVIVNIEQDV